jgi:hypothetical protein
MFIYMTCVVCGRKVSMYNSEYIHVHLNDVGRNVSTLYLTAIWYVCGKRYSTVSVDIHWLLH